MNKIPLIESACNDLLQYGMFDAKTRVKYLVKRYLLRRKTAGEDLIFWPTGLLAAGLWHCRQELLGKEKADHAAWQSGAEAGADSRALQNSRQTVGMIEQALAAYYERWQKKGMPLLVIDDLLAGETLLEAYEEIGRTGSESCLGLSKETLRQMLDRMADFAAKADRDRAGSILYRPGQGNGYIFADTVGLCCPFLYRYGDLFGKTEFRELALVQITNFLAYGMDDLVTGLPYHGYDLLDGGCKLGIIGWGRAVGWLLRGMTGCMTSDHGRQQLEAPCKKLVEAVMSYRRPQGFSWHLQAPEGPEDTSATAMICAAVRQGMARGGLSDKLCEEMLAAGRSVLAHFVQDGRVWGASAECEGFSCYPQRYGAYPWALGPALVVLPVVWEYGGVEI